MLHGLLSEASFGEMMAFRLPAVGLQPEALFFFFFLSSGNGYCRWEVTSWESKGRCFLECQFNSSVLL